MSACHGEEAKNLSVWFNELWKALMKNLVPHFHWGCESIYINDLDLLVGPMIMSDTVYDMYYV